MFLNLLQELCESSLIEDVEYSATTKNLLVRLKDNMIRYCSRNFLNFLTFSGLFIVKQIIWKVKQNLTLTSSPITSGVH